MLIQRAPLLAITGIVLTATLCPKAIAQAVDPTSPESRSAVDLTIPAWVGGGHDSSGAGWDGVSRFQGFIPLRQSPGDNITFLEPRFLFDNDGNIGGSLLLGHRIYDSQSDRTFGGYVAFDHRETDDSSFSMMGLGLESLGEVWDFRFNAYIPLGDNRHLVDESRSDSGYSLSTQFERNLLVLSSRREERVTRTYEAGLFGLDAEAGAKLAEWTDGDLRAFGGVYFYDAPGTDSTLGWRLRLQARPTQNLTLGLALQDDNLFGTNLVASVGFTFPRIRPRGPISEPETVVARLGEPIFRNPNIAVDTQRDTEITVEENIQPLRNPEEEQSYRFIHVTLGRQGGNGTFENPFGTVQEALDASVSDGNTIVYVDAGRNPNIPAFTIPDRVRVLSQGPVQEIAGLPFPGFPDAPARLPFSPGVNYRDGILVRIPFSGDGRLPTIQQTGATDLVTMGDRTILSGFQIADAPANGVAANGVENVEIRNNIITNAAERGIFLNDVYGSVVLFDNRISGSQGGSGSVQGLLIRNTTDEAVDISIQRQQLENNRVGLEIAASGNQAQQVNPQQIVSITDTNIQNSDQQGILLTTEQSGTQQVEFSNGRIQDSGAEGVFARATSTGAQELTIEDSTISGSGGDGIRAQAGIQNGSSTAAQEVFLRRNRIENNAGNGITIEANEIAAQEFTIDSNIIQNNGGNGIQGVVNNVAFQEYVTDVDNGSLGISNNTITNNGGQGISLTVTNSGTMVADIQGNNLSNNNTNGDPDLEVTATANTNDVCVVLNNNTTAAGIQLNNNPSGFPALFQVGDLNTLSVRNFGGVTIQPDLSTFTNRPGITSCFRDGESGN
jgi:trimeric autotransporter adhesin